MSDDNRGPDLNGALTKMNDEGWQSPAALSTSIRPKVRAALEDNDLRKAVIAIFTANGVTGAEERNAEIAKNRATWEANMEICLVMAEANPEFATTSRKKLVQIVKDELNKGFADTLDGQKLIERSRVSQAFVAHMKALTVWPKDDQAEQSEA